MLKGLGNLASMMKQAQEMQGRMGEAKEKIAEMRVEGIAGGEMVKVEATGDMRILNTSIDPIAPGDSGQRDDRRACHCSDKSGAAEGEGSSCSGDG